MRPTPPGNRRDSPLKTQTGGRFCHVFFTTGIWLQLVVQFGVSIFYLGLLCTVEQHNIKNWSSVF